MGDGSNSFEFELRPPGLQRQKFSTALEKYAIILGLTCNPGYCMRFASYAFRYGIFPLLGTYIVIQLFIGIPMFVLEYFIGQFSSGSIISMYSVAPALKGTGITSVVLLLVFLSYGILNAGYNLVILGYSFTMPWTHCGNYWNTAQCQMPNHLLPNSTVWIDENYTTITDPSEEFTSEMRKGMGSSFLWMNALGGAIVCILVCFVASSGTRIMGKVALGTMAFRIGTTVVLLIVGLATALPNGGDYGLKLYFYGIDNLLNPNTWGDTLQLILGGQLMGVGILTTFGSYDKLRNNCLIDALVVAVFNFIYPFIYGIFIMAAFGYLGIIMDKDVNEIRDYQKIPLALSLMPGNFLWVFIFELMTFAGYFGYYVIVMESIITSLMDEYPKVFANRQIVAVGICVPLTLISMIYCIGDGIGYKIALYLDLVTWVATWGNMSWIMFTFIYLYGAGRLVRDIRHVLPRISWAVTWPCYLSWIVIIPLFYAVIHAMIYERSHFEYFEFSTWATENHNILISLFLCFTTIYAIVYLIMAKGTFVQRLVSGFRPSVNWGPKESEENVAWQEYSKKRPICCGCSHPDCCTPIISGEADDVAIPLTVEMTSKPEPPTAHSNAVYPRQPSDEKPNEDNKAESTLEEGLYPDLPNTP